MPDWDVTTIKDLIYYQYAKIIARSSLHASDEVIYLFKDVLNFSLRQEASHNADT